MQYRILISGRPDYLAPAWLGSKREV